MKEDQYQLAILLMAICMVFFVQFVLPHLVKNAYRNGYEEGLKKSAPMYLWEYPDGTRVWKLYEPSVGDGPNIKVVSKK